MSVISPSFRARVRSSIEEPVARFFGRLGFSPNALTLIGFGIAIVGAYFAAIQSWLVAGVIVAFGAIFDLFDGALARATGKTSRFGAFLDSTFDRAGEAVVYVGVAIGLTLSTEPLAALAGASVATSAMAASFMVSYTRAKAESLGFSSGSGMAAVGFAPREVRTALVVIGFLAAGAFNSLLREDCTSVSGCGVLGPDGGDALIVGALALITVLAAITTIQRIYFVYRQSKSDPN
jgi:archaetidylinositol phosphate synthase